MLAYGFLNYIRNNWNKFEVFIQAILLTDFGLDVYVLAAGEAGPYIYKHMLRCFDVLSLLRILRVIRLIKVSLSSRHPQQARRSRLQRLRPLSIDILPSDGYPGRQSGHSPFIERVRDRESFRDSSGRRHKLD